MEKIKLNIKERRGLRLESYKIAIGLEGFTDQTIVVASEIYQDLLPYVGQEKFEVDNDGGYNGRR